MPHFVQDERRLNRGDETGVLYWPSGENKTLDWNAMVFLTPNDAIVFLDMIFGKNRVDF